MAVAECLERSVRAFRVCLGLLNPHKRCRICGGGGGSLTLVAQAALICYLMASRLSIRRCGSPATVAALTALSASSLLLTPTWAGNHTRVTATEGEVLVILTKDSTARFYSVRPGNGLSCCVRALINGWLSMKNQKLCCSLDRCEAATSAAIRIPTSSASSIDCVVARVTQVGR